MSSQEQGEWKKCGCKSGSSGASCLQWLLSMNPRLFIRLGYKEIRVIGQVTQFTFWQQALDLYLDVLQQTVEIKVHKKR